MKHAKYNATTPTVVSDLIRSFCAELEPNAEPLYIDHLNDDEAKLGRCYINAANFCERFGGGKTK